HAPAHIVLVFLVRCFALSKHRYVIAICFFLLVRPSARSSLFPYTTLFRSAPRTKLCHRAGCAAFTSIVRRSGRGPSSSRSQCTRSEEHTSELQSRENIVCRLLLEKKKLFNSYQK